MLAPAKIYELHISRYLRICAPSIFRLEYDYQEERL